MNIKIELTRDEIVNLLSTAASGSAWIGLSHDFLTDGIKPITIEDRCADLLIEGKDIIIYDTCAQDESDAYGNLPHQFGGNGMEYRLTLEDINKALSKVVMDDLRSEGGCYACRCLMTLVDEETDFDADMADTLIQHILFGELVFA